MSEALVVGAALKLHARRLQASAEVFSEAGAIAEAGELKGMSAALDDFADRLYVPFIGPDGIANISDHADGA